MNVKQAVLWATLTCAAVAPLCAQTLAEKDKINRSNQSLTQYANRVNSACGSHIQFSVNWQSFIHSSQGLMDTTSTWPGGTVQNAGDALINICVTEAGKAAVQQKVHSVVLSYADGEEESLAGGVFNYKCGYKGCNVDNPEKWLKNHL